MSHRSEGLKPGDQGHVGGVEYRIVLGRKRSRVVGEVDGVFELRTPGGLWVRPKHKFALRLVQFMVENEDILFPQAEGFRGGRYFLDALDRAVGISLSTAEAQLKQEIDNSRAREAA